MPALLLPPPVLATPTLGGAFTPGWSIVLLLLLLTWIAVQQRVGIQPRLRVLAFASGWLLLGFCTFWPLGVYAHWLFSAHMAQHMLLLAVVAPLLVLGWPAGLVQRAASPGLALLVCALQTAVIWVAHVPAVVTAVHGSALLGWLMPLIFLVTGLCFWLVLFAAPRGLALLGLLLTMIPMGLLGALLTFATTPRYAPFVDTAPALGVSALADQQLAGLIMWVPAALPYLLAALLLAACWLSDTPGATGRWRLIPGGS